MKRAIFSSYVLGMYYVSITPLEYTLDMFPTNNDISASLSAINIIISWKQVQGLSVYPNVQDTWEPQGFAISAFGFFLRRLFYSTPHLLYSTLPRCTQEEHPAVRKNCGRSSKGILLFVLTLVLNYHHQKHPFHVVTPAFLFHRFQERKDGKERFCVAGLFFRKK